MRKTENYKTNSVKPFRVWYLTSFTFVREWAFFVLCIHDAGRRSSGELRCTRVPSRCFRRGLRGFDMTQTDFASRIGVSQGYLSAVEHGRYEVGAGQRSVESLILEGSYRAHFYRG